MIVFLDSSILIEYIKGTQTELLDAIFDSSFIPQINHIVYSEFMFHFLSVMSGKSPLTLKGSLKIKQLLELHEPIEFVKNLQILNMNEDILVQSYDVMKNYNLLPNDALILSTCKWYNIRYLATYDSDFKSVYSNEHIEIIASPNHLIF